MTRRQFAGGAVGAAPFLLRAAGGLRAGAAVANVTPLLGSSLAGGMTDRIAADVHDDLHARALVLDDGVRRVAIVLVDSCAIAGELIQRAKRRIGLPEEQVLIAATHTHSAPPAAHLFQSPPDPKYTDWLVERIADSVQLAVNRLEPARIGWGTGRKEGQVFNRRYFLKPGAMPPNPFGSTTDQVKMNPPVGSPDIVKAAGPVDPEVGVLAVSALDGRPLAALGSYALHYVGGNPGNHVSADYFAVWADATARRLGEPRMVAMLGNGCSGNVNNVNFLKPAERRPPYEKMSEVGEDLADESARVWRTVSWQSSVQLAGALEWVELRVRKPSPDEVAQAKGVLSRAPQGTLKELAQIYAREAVLLEGYPNRVKAPVQALRIGNLGIATFPGEAFVEMGLEVKARSPLKPTFLIELANAYHGYIPTVEAHRQGGYETWRAKSSYLETEAAPKLVAAAMRCLESVRG